MLEVYNIATDSDSNKSAPEENMESLGFDLDLVDVKYVNGLFNNHADEIKKIQDKFSNDQESLINTLENVEVSESIYKIYNIFSDGYRIDTGLTVKLEYYKYIYTGNVGIVRIKIPGFLIEQPDDPTHGIGKGVLLRRLTPDSDDLSEFLGSDSFEYRTPFYNDENDFTQINTSNVKCLSDYSYTLGDDSGNNIGRVFEFLDDYPVTTDRYSNYPTKIYSVPRIF